MAVIYKITNFINGKLYIGQTTLKPTERWKIHQRSAKYSYYKTYLYFAMRKHGIEHFGFEIIEELGDADQVKINEREIYWINHYNTRCSDRGYNLKEGGSFGKHSQSSIEKIRKSSTGRKRTKAAQMKINLYWKDVKGRGLHTSWYGCKHTEASKMKMSDARKIQSTRFQPRGKECYNYKEFNSEKFVELVTAGFKLKEIIIKLKIDESVLRSKWKQQFPVPFRQLQPHFKSLRTP